MNFRLRLKFLALLAFSLATYGCSSERNERNKLPGTEDTSRSAIKTYSQEAEDSLARLDSLMEFADCGAFLDYYDGLAFDSTLEIEGEKYSLRLRPITDSFFHLPESLEPCSKQPVCPVEIVIIRLSHESIDSLVLSRFSLKEYLGQDQELVRKFGAPLSLSIEKIVSSNHTMRLSTSFSIPFTDLGQRIAFDVNLSTMKLQKAD
jgi:hypothetical protein